MGKILVKSPATAHPVMAAAGGQAVQDLFRVRSKPGQLVGGALGGLSALTSLADASESQQDAFSAAQMAAGRGLGAYIGAGKTVDTVAPQIEQGFGKVRDMAARYDPRASQQVGVQASRGQVQRFKEKDFKIPKGFQLGVYGTPMGGGNQAIRGQRGIQPNLFSGKPTPMDTTNVTAPPTNLSYQVPTADTMAANQPTPPIGATQESYGYPSGPLPNPNPQPVEIGSTQVGMPASAAAPPNPATMSAEDIAAFYASQGQVKNAGEPMELAFRLLKSVMR